MNIKWIIFALIIIGLTGCSIFNDNYHPIDYYRVVDAVWINSNEVLVGISFDNSGYGDANGFIIKHINWTTNKSVNYYLNMSTNSSGLQRFIYLNDQLFEVGEILDYIDTICNDRVFLLDMGRYANLSSDSQFIAYYETNGNNDEYFCVKNNITNDSTYYILDSLLYESPHFNIDWNKKTVFWYYNETGRYYNFEKDSLYTFEIPEYYENIFREHTYSKVYNDSIQIYNGMFDGVIMTLHHPFTDSMYETVSNKVDNWFSNSNGEYINIEIVNAKINLYSSDGTALKTIQFDRSEIE